MFSERYGRSELALVSRSPNDMTTTYNNPPIPAIMFALLATKTVVEECYRSLLNALSFLLLCPSQHTVFQITARQPVKGRMIQHLSHKSSANLTKEVQSVPPRYLWVQ